MAGRELKTVISEGRLDLDSVRKIFLQILAGLGIAHSVGVVHRDVKPQNIFVLEDGLTKVADFGIARIDSTGITRTGASLGTPSYMSPEQFMGSNVDNSSDLYAAAAVLYEMISGVKAFSGTSITEVMYAVLEKEPRNLRELSANVPVALAHVVNKGLAKKREERFQNAEEFTRALEAAYSGNITNLNALGRVVFESTEKLTDQVLPTIHVTIRNYHDDIRPLIERRVRRSVDANACKLVKDTAASTLGYHDLVRLARALRTDSAQRRAAFTLANEFSKGRFQKSERARLASQLAWMLHEQPIVIEFSAESSMVGDGCRRLKG